MNPNNTKEVSIFSARNFIRLLSLCCIILVFCPAFLVSCSGEEMDITVMSAVKGVSFQGKDITEPKPIVLLCLILPIAILVCTLFKKQLSAKLTSLLVLIGAIADLIMWNVFRSTAQDIALDNMCAFDVTGWFKCTMVVLVIMVILSIITIATRLRIDDDIVKLIIKEDTITCSKCGARIKKNQTFCTACGTPINTEADTTEKKEE